MGSSPNHSPATLTAFRWFAVLLVLALGLAAFAFSSAVRTTDDALARVSRHDVAWSGTQGRHEAARLERDVLASALEDGQTVSRDELELAYSIIRNRMRIWGTGDFKNFLIANDRAAASFAGLQNEVTLFGVELDQASPNAEKLLRSAASIRDFADQIGMRAHTTAVNEIEQVRRNLYGKQAVQRTLISSLLVVGFLLVVVTMVQNRSLMAAGRSARESANRFAYLAQHDSLTGLLNRAGFSESFEQVARSAGPDERIAVIALDLDGFKAINDSFGHSTGDALLKAVAERLHKHVDGWDRRNIVSRFGGDEFVIALILPLGDEVMQRALELCDLLCKPVEFDGGSIVVAATMGVALSDHRNNCDRKTSMDADLALTWAKASGKGTVCLFHDRMRDQLARHLDVERNLETALREGHIVPYYQPQLDLATGRVVGVEALARWHHCDEGWISPAEFIPVAEASGQIVRLGRTILSAACKRARTLPDHISVSVNMSVVQLMRDNAVDEIIELLSDSGLRPDRLKIEVTESTVMTDAKRGLVSLQRLKHAGVGIALDDFGVGYSALSYLHQFPWDELKIDKSFVKAIGQDERSLAIVKSVISLAKQLGIKVVAEGVEEQYQLELLLQHECDIAQGRLLSPPVSGDELAEIVSRRFLRETGISTVDLLGSTEFLQVGEEAGIFN